MTLTAVPTTMIGRRRPKRLWMRSDQCPTIGGTTIAKKEPNPSIRPSDEPCWSRGTRWRIW